MKTSLVLAATSLLALAGCAPAARSAAAVAADQQALMAADREFCRVTRERGVEGWVSFFAPDGMQIVKKRPPVVGAEAIRALMGPVFADAHEKLLWEPDRAEVAASGDVGYTIGRGRYVRIEPDGKESVLARSRYVTFWRRQADGTWKVAVDMGTEAE